MRWTCGDSRVRWTSCPPAIRAGWGSGRQGRQMSRGAAPGSCGRPRLPGRFRDPPPTGGGAFPGHGSAEADARDPSRTTERVVLHAQAQPHARRTQAAAMSHPRDAPPRRGKGTVAHRQRVGRRATKRHSAAGRPRGRVLPQPPPKKQNDARPRGATSFTCANWAHQGGGSVESLDRIARRGPVIPLSPNRSRRPEGTRVGPAARQCIYHGKRRLP